MWQLSRRSINTSFHCLVYNSRKTNSDFWIFRGCVGEVQGRFRGYLGEMFGEIWGTRWGVFFGSLRGVQICLGKAVSGSQTYIKPIKNSLSLYIYIYTLIKYIRSFCWGKFQVEDFVTFICEVDSQHPTPYTTAGQVWSSMVWCFMFWHRQANTPRYAKYLILVKACFLANFGAKQLGSIAYITGPGRYRKRRHRRQLLPNVQVVIPPP